MPRRSSPTGSIHTGTSTFVLRSDDSVVGRLVSIGCFQYGRIGTDVLALLLLADAGTIRSSSAEQRPHQTYTGLPDAPNPFTTFLHVMQQSTTTFDS